MKPYGVKGIEIHNEPYVKKGSYGRYQQTRSKLGYKVSCKMAKTRARQLAKRQINEMVNSY